MKVGAFVPRLIAGYDREKPWSVWLPGSVLFADVSGFTPMSEALAVLGAEGAEILTDKLNRYFAAMIRIVHGHGGDVMKFGGDAILCFFPGKDALPAALAAAVRMQQAMSRFENIRTPVRKFRLQMKIGAAHGEVVLAGLGDPNGRRDYVFAGRPVDMASEAEHHAQPGDIIVAALARPAETGAVPVAHGFWRLLHSAIRNPKSEIGRPAIRNPKPAPLAESQLRPYIIPEIYRVVSEGYSAQAGALLGIVPAFLQFSGFHYNRKSFKLQKLDGFFKTIVQVTQQYGGALNRISMGDKGSTFFILFGAPRVTEKKEELAAQWALDIVDLIAKSFPQITVRLGMSTGRVFAGIVGGNDRYEYTVMGDTVNLAARLMQGAEMNQICTNTEFRHTVSASFEFASLGARQFKGISSSQEIFSLLGRSREEKKAQRDSPFAGRAAEIQELLAHMKSVPREGPRMIVMEGEAGVGKSFLAERIFQQAQQDGWKVISGKGEITRQSHTYGPWRQIFAGFEGFNFQENIDESAKNLFHHQISQEMLKKISGPTLLFLDDLHWFDTLSLDLLAAFLNHLKEEPVLILGASRREWKKDDFQHRSTFHLMAIGELDRPGVRQMAVQFLNGPARDALVEFLYERTRGNPFFTRQVLEYLKAKNLLTTRLGEWTIERQAALTEALSGEEIIIARQNALNPAERSHLAVAACMGPTFSRRVLKSAMAAGFDKPAFDSLCSLGYFQALDRDGATFPHALVQETIYHALLNRERKRNHLRIAMAMESLFARRLHQHLPNLANHFYLAGGKEKAARYCLQAGDDLYARISYPEALEFHRKAFESLPARNAQRLQIQLKMADDSIRAGKLKEALALSEDAIRQCGKSANRSIFIDALIRKFDALRHIGDYSYIEEASESLKRTSVGQFRQIIYFIAEAHFRRGEFDKAEPLLRSLIDAASGSALDELRISAYVFLASIFRAKRNFGKALSILREAMHLATKSGNLYQGLRLEFEHGYVYGEKGDHVGAKRIFRKVVSTAEGMGDFYLLALSTLTLGELESDLGNYESARQHLHEAMRLGSITGALAIQGQSLVDLGIICYYERAFPSSYKYYLDATKFLERAGDATRKAWAYFNLAEVALDLGRLTETDSWLTQAEVASESTHDPAFEEGCRELRKRLQSQVEINAAQTTGKKSPARSE